MSDQLRADLEQLLDLLEEGWCKYRTPLGVQRQHGTGGGCLGDKMFFVANNGVEVRYGFEAAERYDDMAEALGFPRSNTYIENKSCDIGADLANWNDYEATWDMVKERVKDAIGKL